MHTHAAHKRLGALAALGIIALAALIGFFVNATGGTARQPPPGLTAGVSALDNLPPEANVPADVVRNLNALPADVVGVVAQTQKKVRKLRSSLGTSGTDIYAFRSSTRSACAIVPKVNNAIFAELPRDGAQATVVISYVDADDQTATISLGG